MSLTLVFLSGMAALVTQRRLLLLLGCKLLLFGHEADAASAHYSIDLNGIASGTGERGPVDHSGVKETVLAEIFV